MNKTGITPIIVDCREGNEQISVVAMIASRGERGKVGHFFFTAWTVPLLSRVVESLGAVVLSVDTF